MKDRILNALMLLAVAAALILTLIREAPEETASAPLSAVTVLATPHPAEAYRQQRADTRRQEKNALLALAEDETASDAIRQLAEEQLRSLMTADETELAMEGALAGAGFPHGLCICRGGKITLMADQAPDARTAAFLLDLAREVSGVSAENIRIWGYSFNGGYDIIPSRNE